MDIQKLENGIGSVAGRLKMLGGSITALGLSLAGLDILTKASPKMAAYAAGAGLLLHGAATACNEGADMLAGLVGLIQQVVDLFKTPPPTKPA